VQGVGFESPGSLSKIPDHYELSLIDGRAFVNLAGGASRLYPGGSTQDRPQGPSVRGRVVDAQGRPIAGAVVIIDDRIDIMAGHLAGITGATSDARGEFSLEAAPAGTVAIAVHSSGWSELVETATTPLVLRMRGHGRLRGRATYNGKGESFNLFLKTRPESKLAFHYQTDPDGRYVMASVPPGPYTISVQLAQTIAGGVSKSTVREVSIVDGETAELDVAQTSGTVVVVTPLLPAGAEPPGIVEHWLFGGTVIPADIDSVRTRAKAERTPGILFGGQDAMTPNQFHDITAGDYVTCVVIDRTALFGCASVRVTESDPVREVGLQVAAPAASK